MDCKLAAGDQATDSRGLPLTVTGLEEIAQQAAIRLTVRRGSLATLPTMGSQLHQLRRAGNAALQEDAVAAVREALLPMGDVWAEEITARYEGALDRLVLTLTLRVAQEALPLTLTI